MVSFPKPQREADSENQVFGFLAICLLPLDQNWEGSKIGSHD